MFDPGFPCLPLHLIRNNAHSLSAMQPTTHLALAVASGILPLTHALGATYDLIKSYEGSTFFQDWTY